MGIDTRQGLIVGRHEHIERMLRCQQEKSGIQCGNLVQPHLLFQAADPVFEASFILRAQVGVGQLFAPAGQDHLLAVIAAGVWFHRHYLTSFLYSFPPSANFEGTLFLSRVEPMLLKFGFFHSSRGTTLPQHHA